jgi:hypothetical protein
MVKTSDWIRLGAVLAFVIYIFMQMTVTEQKKRSAPPSSPWPRVSPLEAEEDVDEVPEPPKNDGYLEEKELPPADPDTISVGSDRAFGEKYPLIIVDGMKLDYDYVSGHYHYTGTKNRAVFVRLETGEYILGDNAWDDAASALKHMSKMLVK